MIETIENIFYKQAKESDYIKGFVYGRTYKMGSGNDTYPLLWLEDPIAGTYQTNYILNSINFSILFLPQNMEIPVIELQSRAFNIGLSILERIKKQKKEDGLMNIKNWNYTTLVSYYDDDACGCRFSAELNIANPQNLCKIEDSFSSDNTINERIDSTLPNFDIPTSNTCAVFANKMPVFDIKKKDE